VARSRVANFGFKDDGYYNEEGQGGGGGNGGEASNNNAAPNASSATLPTAPNNNINNMAPNNNNTEQASTLQYPAEYGQAPAAAALANLATAASRQQQQGYPNLPPPQQRMIPDPSTLMNQYQMQQQQQQNDPSKPTLPELQLPSISRPNLPQNDGAADDEHLTTKEIDQRIEDMIQSSQIEQVELSFTAKSFSGEPLALDSLPDSVKELMKDARERALRKNKKSLRNISQLDGEGDDQEAGAGENTTNNDDDINSDLDDTDDDDDDGEGGEEIEHIILCLYDKVTRTKNKWKCILKDGIMLVNGRDYLFHRANGDFEW
jgi:transcription initiation factor TFIIA large subunit